MSFGIFSEIFSTLKRNKLRTFLTGFSISWGIFMLIVLLSAGNGLKNGVTSNFEDRSANVVRLQSGQSSTAYKGYPKWRRIIMDRKDSLLIAASFPEVDKVVPVYNIWSKEIRFGEKTVISNLEAVYPTYPAFANIKMLEGRFINNTDISEMRKCVVISNKDAELLFKDKNPVGKYILVEDIAYRIVGIFKGGGQWRNSIYIPFSSAMGIYNPSKQLTQISFSVNGLETEKANEEFNTRVRKRLSQLHQFDPDDRNAIYIRNNLQNYMETLTMFRGLNIFVWIIGIGTLIAGIVGISNIMLITVKERTKEFGIRKAIGAKPSSILRLVVTESLVITTLFGYIGMILGIGLMEAVNFVLQMGETMSGEEMSVFKNPTVDIGIILSATLVLIIAGVLAGYFPARKAVSTKPIEALRYE